MKINESYIERRKFLCGMLGGGTAALGAGAALPLVIYASGRREPPPPFLEIEKADYQLAPGEGKTIMYGRIPALLIQPDDPRSELKVFVATCTHLDCMVAYRKEKKDIFCACHEGIYDVDGQVTAGPPPKPLAQFFKKFKGDKLVIALEEEKLDEAI
jgi:Rieske Fe-S protein